MPFDLTMLQLYSNTWWIFWEFLDQFVIRYIDDILIFSKTEKKKHKEHVYLVLKKLCKTGLYAKYEKCMFHQYQVEFLGYIVSQTGISMYPCKVAIILRWEVPKGRFRLRWRSPRVMKKRAFVKCDWPKMQLLTGRCLH